MKKYDFPVWGSFGPRDSWDGEFTFELTDEEAERLEASARKEPRWNLDEDPEINDIWDKVYDAAFENECENVDQCFIEEEKDSFLQDDDNWSEPEYSVELECWIRKTKPMTDLDFARQYLENASTFNVGYPEELRDLGDEEE